MIKIKNLTKEYQGKKVVDDLSFDVEKGHICGFIGHNGAGKSTTLKAVLGIIPFEQGEILVDEINIKTQAIEAKKIMAYVPDNPDIYEFMTGIDYINFICDMFKIKKNERKEKYEKYTNLFEITDVLQDRVSSYSHGMKQKLVLTAAFMHEPKVLILDEPFVGLDPKASNSLKLLMRELCDLGGCILYSTHVLEVAEQICDTVVMLKKGKLVFKGDIQEVLSNKSDKSKSLESIFLEENED